MTVLVYLIGVLLVIAGGAFIGHGVPIVRLEIGWTEIIGGAVAGSAGFVILAIGVVLTKLHGLERAFLGLNVATSLGGAFAEADEPSMAMASASHALPVPAGEPVVLAEPPLQDAPLHQTPVRPTMFDIPVEQPTAHDLDIGAPSLAATDDHAPPLPGLEAVAELAEPPMNPPPIPPPLEPARTDRPNFLATFLARRTQAAERAAPRRDEAPKEPLFAPPAHAELQAAPRTSIDLSSGWDEPERPSPPLPDDTHPLRGSYHPLDVSVAEPAGPPAHEPEEPVAHTEDEAPPNATHEEAASVPEAAEPEQAVIAPVATPATDHGTEPEADVTAPVVVGRYNAGSASYIMYSNGMIEVETESGTHQFASMQELKAFIERRDSARV